ncbi:MAG TPA: glucosyltransferase domain-containing protein [Pseudomonas sp.]|uniref:glucosyltransferase domain-containing protein n=1 Tax=Pseudomonas sp. TaxID=306 RepID=UPI002B4A14CB|nr:glucosyltransferase domain-containing protein [Pseudomonas sp.]HKS13194.1 glucosyltransferase domain-containing protein [Pseudomonas sp.]
MSTPAPWARHLSQREVQVLCLLAVGLHLLPLLLADHFYIDDSWRSQMAGNGWTQEGRLLSDWLYAGLSFSASAPNLFPLPLLMAASAVALALARLVRHYFVAPQASAVLVVLPLWYNPFFLQNLSYQYDGPAMALAMAAGVLAITLEPSRRRNLVYGALLVAASVSFYQVTINLIGGLCCLEVMRQVVQGADARQVVRHATGRLAQLFGGCLLYVLGGFQLMSPVRTQLLAFDHLWLAAIGQRLGLIAERIGLLVTPGTLWFSLVLLVLAALALTGEITRVVRGDQSPLSRLVLLSGLLLPAPLVLLLIPGLTLLFADFNDGARTLMGLATPMVLVLLLAHRLLDNWSPRLPGLLVVPLLFMLSFSFAYGRILLVQKELQQSLAFSLAHDISSRPALASAPRLYLLEIGSSGQWLPAAAGSFKVMPALRYVLNINFLLLPEMLPRVGLSNFASHAPLDRQQVEARSPTPVIDSKFYAIHLVDGIGYVLMKVPRDPETYRW